MQDTDLPKEVESTTPDFKTELAAKLQELVPEAISDGKVDTQKLKELLDDDTADDSERFGLFWPGKKRAMRAAQEPTTATLKPAKDESKDWDTTENIFIEGDNLEVLKVLQKHYHNKIKMIYIDPPYNTGKDFVYPDNYKEGLASYLEFTKQVDEEGRKISTNSDTDGRYHSNWLNMMYPRLKLARNLLTDDGVIFISIDDNEQDNLKKLCNEIFGEDNYVTQITWYKSYGKNESKYFSNNIEYIFVYQRGGLEHEFLKPKDGLFEVRSILEEAKSEGASPDYAQKRLREFYKKNPNLKGISAYSNVDQTYDAWRSVSMEKPKDPQYFYDILHPLTGKPCKLPKKGWRMPENTAQKYINEGKIVFGKDESSIPNRKYYLSEVEHERVKNFINNSDQGGKDIQQLFPEGSPFDYPKAVSVMKYLIQISNMEDGDVILDFFSGSGTTAHATMELNASDGLNRKHIQVQLPEPTDKKSDAYKLGYRTVSAISLERIKRAGATIAENYAKDIAKRNQTVDFGYRVYRLADSNFIKWHTNSDTNKEAIQQHLLDIRESSNDATTEEDLLTEVLLKQGISLTAPLTHEEINGLSVWMVGENVVSAYLNENVKPTLDQLRAIAARGPAKFIILEDAFQGDDELKTNLVQICKSQKIELWTV